MKKEEIREKIEKTNFQRELEHSINKHGIDNEMDTPDFLLAAYLVGCLAVYREIQEASKAFHSLKLNSTNNGKIN